jgi:citrate lyase subunit beta/citryl-CoA lyase
LEAAIKQVFSTSREYLLPLIKENGYPSVRDRFRFSRLYLPGNNPYLMLNAGIHQPHGIILDLEDAVAPARKQEARFLVRNALRSLDLYGVERMVRINQGERGIEDLKYIVPHNVHLILVPKCEDATHIQNVEKEIARLKGISGIEQDIYLMPIVESALGVEKAFEIAISSPNIVAMAIGLEDYTADMGVSRTREATESLYARTRFVNACHAAKIQPIDSVFSDVADLDGLARTVKVSKSLGFEGMGCIHPRQIKVIHENLAPDAEEVAKAQKIVDAYCKAEEQGLAVVSLGTKMIDPPVVKRHQKLIDLAVNLGLISKDWRDNYEC